MSTQCKRRGHNFVAVLVESYGSRRDNLSPGRFYLTVCAECMRIPAATYDPSEAA